MKILMEVPNAALVMDKAAKVMVKASEMILTFVEENNATVTD